VEADLNGLNPNVPRLVQLTDALESAFRERLASGARASRHELTLYQAFVFYRLYQRYEAEWFELVAQGLQGLPTTKPVAAWKRFRRDVDHYLGFAGYDFPEPRDPAMLFALGFQVRRAFHHVFREIYGGSMPAARLRAAVWESTFTHDPARYRRDLAPRMGDVPTLIVGESGTGKEIVARAIAASRFIPFDATTGSFVADWTHGFRGVNLMTLPPTLIESELFGHRRGAFTGAVADRKGWLESAGPYGSVFLDEIGDVGPSHPGEAAARAPDALLRARGGDERAPLRGQDPRRDEPRPGGRDARQALPAGFLLAPLRRRDPHRRFACNSQALVRSCEA
jgi:hypothetical protein